MDALLTELQHVLTIAATLAVTALCGFIMAWLRKVLGVIESDSNEGEVRRAALTEAGKLLQSNLLNDPQALGVAADKIIGDLLPAVKAEGYSRVDIKDMIVGAAAALTK